MAAQTVQVLANIAAVLEAAGKSLGHVIKTNVYLADMKDFTAMNAVYGRHFEAPFPARTTISPRPCPWAPQSRSNSWRSERIGFAPLTTANVRA